MSDVYQKATGSAGAKGVDFQVDLISVFLLNALQNLENWKLSTENKLAGKFDDVVLELSDGKAILLQAKHKENKKLSLDQLLSTNSKNDYFSLPKYFFSYMDIKNKFPVKSIIICTNTRADLTILKLLIKNQICSGNILHYKDGSTLFTFNKDIVADLIQNTMEYYKKNLQEKAMDETIITEENITEFLSHLQLYLNYPSGNYLENVIEKMLTTSNSLKNLFSNTTYQDLHTKIKKWFEQPKGEYLTKSRAISLFCKIKSEKYCESLENYKIFFRKNDSGVLDSNKRMIHVIVHEGYLLHLMHIYRFLQNTDDEILYVDPDCDKDMHVNMIEAFALPIYTYLIFISPKFIEESTIDAISIRLVNILHTRKYKKVIFIADKTNKLVQRMNPFELDRLLTLDDLSEDSENKLLKKKSVVFQGEEISLEELFPRPVTAHLKRSLTSDILEKIIRGQKISVGKTLSGLEEELSKYYLERTFERKIGGANDRSTKREHIISENDIYNINEKVILISDSAGTGKTTVLANLATSIKRANPRLWIIRIQLNDCTKMLGDSLKNRKSIGLLELVNFTNDSNMINQLEKIAFSLDGMVVLMLDGIDEISPDYTDLILNLLIQSQKATNVAKVFATTRPCMASQLEKHLNVTSFALVPLTIKNQTDFLTNYWSHLLQLESENHFQRCRCYAEDLLDKIFLLIYDWYSEEGNEFVVIPLHARMLAEIFLENKRSSDWEGCKEYLHSDKCTPKLPEKINISMLYNMFIEQKRDIFISKGNPIKNTAANKALFDQFEECLAYHRSLALDILLESNQRVIFSCYQLDITNVAAKIEKIGIVQRITNQIHFVHRTFAEFFLAEVIFKELQLPNDDVYFQMFFIDGILVQCNFNIVRRFLNSFLHNMTQHLPSDMFNRYKSVADFRFPDKSSFPTKFISNILYGSNEVAQYNDTIIHSLAFEGNTEIIQLLLKSIQFKNTIRSRFKDRFRFFSQKENTLTNLKDLIRYNGINIKNFNSETPLHRAVVGNHQDTVKYLMEIGADINSKNDAESTPLLVAVHNGRWNTACFLLNSGIDFTAADNQDNQLLHLAAMKSKIDIIKFLLNHGMNINSVNRYGRTALHFAVQTGSPETVDLLLAGSIDFNAVDQKGRTALHLTVLVGRLDIVEILLEYRVEVNILDKEGRTALHLAVECDNVGIAECLVNYAVGINTGDEEGRTALHLAVLRGRQHIVELLVRHGVNLNAADKKGRTALHAAVETGRSSTVRCLVEHGADINSRDNEGCTVLHMAVESRRTDIIQFLLKHDVYVNVRDIRGRTALHLAVLLNRQDIIDILNSSLSIL